MEQNKEIYTAKACKLFDGLRAKILEMYDEKIIVIKESSNIYKEIITGINFKRYPKSAFEVNDKEVYIMLDNRIDETKEGYDLIKKYYEETNEQNIYHMLKWFNMNQVDRYKDYIRRFEAKNFDYKTMNNNLVRSRMKNNKRNY